MKYLYLLLILSVLSRMCIGQDIAPGQQAQGYLEGKNVTVDYSTGTFHYKVPLYTLGNGGFSLPISANYAAKGVKKEDPRGLLGYNWTLNTGGIVSRTIRGGIADEEYRIGYLWAENDINSVPLAKDQKRVNLHERDGECDIFTVVFNGRSVHFIIRMTTEHQIYAEPLEQTDVRIECESSQGKVINGWIITDETGNRYIYRQKEWSTNINQEEAISFNGLRNKSYISSWYLSRIEPSSSSPVSFNYRTEVYESGEQEGVLYSNFSYQYTSKYIYGTPLSERTFDFQKYRADFNVQITEAKNYLGSYSLEQQLNNSLYTYIGNGGWVLNPSFGAGLEAINSNFRIMGQLSEFRNISKASNELISVLNELYNTYIKNPSTNAQMAASCFRNAKNYVIQSLEDRNNNIFEREVFNKTFFSVHSPILDNICCSNKILKFSYDHYNMMKGIRLCNISGQRLSEVYFDTFHPEGLQQISYRDRDSVENQRISFEYYQSPSGNYDTGTDLWGYPKLISGQSDKYNSNVDSVFIKNSSLKTIVLSNGGRIHLDYETNRITYPNLMESLNDRNSFLYGGIRIKSFVFDEPSGQRSDTVFYRYPLPGFLVYEEAGFHEKVQYNKFYDQVLSSRIKYKGLAFLNTGNNGIYYRYVQEVMPGYGTKAYLFHVPLIDKTICWYEFYPFWLYALPLGVASYDNNGNLKQLAKNKYITSWQFDHLFMDISSLANKDYFITDNRFSYNRNLPQMKAYEYYMDGDNLNKYYRNQGIQNLYTDGYMTGRIDPYNEIYIPNIAPRTSVVLPNLSYSLYYGGETLLQSHSEYHFDDIVTTQPDITDFSRESSGTLFSQTDYFYDHPKGMLNATRIVTTDSRGDVYTTLKKQVGNMSDVADATITRMKAANMKALPVKEIRLKNNLLQQESVSIYTDSDTSGRYFAGVKEHWTYIPEESLPVSVTYPDPALFTYNREKYIREEGYEYRQMGDFFLPVEAKTRSGKNAACYDFNMGRTILQVPDGNADMLIAVDCGKNINSLFNGIPEITSNRDIYEACNILNNNCRILISVSKDTRFHDYTETEEHQKILELLDAVAYTDTIRFNQLINDEIFISSSLIKLFIDEYSLQANRYRLSINRDKFFRVLVQLSSILSSLKKFDSEFWNFCYNYKKKFPIDNIWTIKELAGKTKWKMYILTSEPEPIYYTVSYKEGKIKKDIRTITSSFCTLQIFDIDLSPYEGIVSVTVEVPWWNNNIAYVAFLPADAEFEATSYNVDGTVFCKFNQNSQLERYEYDAAGRLIKVFDRDNNLLLENQYNDLFTK